MDDQFEAPFEFSTALFTGEFDADLLDRFEARAAKLGKTPDQLLGEVLFDYLAAQRRRELEEDEEA